MLPLWIMIGFIVVLLGVFGFVSYYLYTHLIQIKHLNQNTGKVIAQKRAPKKPKIEIIRDDEVPIKQPQSSIDKGNLFAELRYTRDLDLHISKLLRHGIDKKSIYHRLEQHGWQTNDITRRYDYLLKHYSVGVKRIVYLDEQQIKKENKTKRQIVRRIVHLLAKGMNKKFICYHLEKIGFIPELVNAQYNKVVSYRKERR